MEETFTAPWDPANHLRTDEDMAAYLEAALEEADATLVTAALGDIARAKGMTQVAREAGLGRESLDTVLSPAGKPEFATIFKVGAALGLQLNAAPAAAKGAHLPIRLPLGPLTAGGLVANAATKPGVVCPGAVEDQWLQWAGRKLSDHFHQLIAPYRRVD